MRDASDTTLTNWSKPAMALRGSGVGACIPAWGTGKRSVRGTVEKGTYILVAQVIKKRFPAGQASWRKAKSAKI
jgi:hypothetical protein